MPIPALPRVALLETFAPAMRDKVRDLAGPGLALIFTDSDSDADRAQALATADYAVVRGVRMGAGLLEAAPGLRLIHQWGTGTDHMPVAAALARGIAVARSPGRNAPSVADLTVGLMLACLRRIPQSDARLRAGGWADPALWNTGRDLTGARVGLVGWGAIAQGVAARLAGFGCTLRHTRASGDDGSPGFMALDELIGWADVLSLHAPLTEGTRGLIGPERLARMPRGAVLINTARGELVDEPALAAALATGQVGAAGLDAFADEPLTADAPILSAPNTVLSPHVGGRTRDNLARMVRHWADNIRTHAAGGRLAPGDLVTRA